MGQVEKPSARFQTLEKQRKEANRVADAIKQVRDVVDSIGGVRKLLQQSNLVEALAKIRQTVQPIFAVVVVVS